MSGPHPVCRGCGAALLELCVDLGVSPLANGYVRPEQLHAMEPFFPLRMFVCRACLLAQAEDFETPETIFSDYAYFSSYSTSWLAHCERYTRDVIERYGLGPQHRVVEIASNDGYLLQFFAERQIPVLGIEPAANVAEVAIGKGIPTRVEFFDSRLASELAAESKADLLIGNNVLAHVPDLNDFVAGMKLILAERGQLTMEFPHILNLLREVQFDTIYHEHFSYFSLLALRRIFGGQGLRIFDVDRIPTHGGSLRIHVCHADDPRETTERVAGLLDDERRHGLDDIATYRSFGHAVVEEKRRILRLLVELREEGRSIVGYGAPAKGNVLLNYCGIRTDILDYTTDLNPEKQGLYLPGVRIPIRHPDEIRETQPDYVMILPWNLREEIMEQLAYVRDWGGRFLARAPSIQVFE
jgi:hypothetical protein